MKLLAAILVAGLTAGGCSSKPELCAPPPLTVTPEGAAPGHVLTLAAGSGDCAAGKDRTYHVALAGAGQEVPVGTVTPARDGSFRLSFTVPSVVPGDYDVVVRGSTLESCSDPDQSCAQYSTHVRVTP